MTDFTRWLFNLLWESGEDCCSKCSRCKPTEYCDNCGDQGRIDTSVCFEGMKEYFEKNG